MTCDPVWKSVSQCKREARKALERKLGRKLRPGEVVRHTCDVPRCRAPAHLVPGSVGDNNRDTASRRRHVYWNTKLSPTLRKEIAMRFLFGGITQAALSREYGVSDVLVSRCVRRLLADPKWDGYLGA